MQSGTVRKGITQAHFNRDQAKFVYGELFFISAVAGYASESWYIGGGTFISLIILMMIPLLNILLAVTLASGWAWMGYGIGHWISDEASYVIALFTFVIGLGMHFTAIEWTRDLSDRKERNF